MLLGVCGSIGHASGNDGFRRDGRNWKQPNLNAANTRATGGPIDSASVQHLRVAWTAPLKADNAFYGGLSSTPIIVNGVVYIQDMHSNVEAHDLATGTILWRKTYEEPSVGPNGLAYANGLLYGATETFAFALSAATGETVWNSRNLPRNGNEGVDMAPAVYDGTVYISTTPGNYGGFYESNAAGVLWALNAKTGAKKWTFKTVPFSLWGDPSRNTGGGLWEPPGFDGRGGVYIGIGNPGPTNAGTPGNVWAKSRPGPNLYTNSVVKLNQHTGKLQWYHQVIPHDIYDWDSQISPIYDRSAHRVYAAGKYGRVLAFDPQTGKLLWETFVGRHNGHDYDSVLALKHQYSRLPKFPFTLLPGEAGGVLTPMAKRGSTLYVPVVNVPYRILSPGTSTADFRKGTGEMVAISTATGKKLWVKKLPSPLFGAATVVNDLVFAADYSGTIYALKRATGAVVWHAQMPAGTNAQIAVSGNTLVTAASAPQPGETPAIIAYRLAYY